jgi:histidyl-tRNA synthetase
MKFQRPKGTKDILPNEIPKWKFVERTIAEVMDLYNFREIRTPAFENTSLFTRGVGTETDMVGKEMYSFTDKGGNPLTLKPEMTAPVMRAYLENGLYNEFAVQKLYYITGMFRYEKPQEGRYREHSQFGAEIIGSDDVYSDTEIISLAREVYRRLGILNCRLKLNSIGKPEERRKYITTLKKYLEKNIRDLSADSRRRYDTNPLRILDSKNPGDRKITAHAPHIIDTLSSESRRRFDMLCQRLNNMNVPFEIDFRLVRGLDYYTDTTFEFVSDKLGAHDAIGGGGRYDGLAEALGGKPVPGVGFGSGIERVIIAAEKSGFEFPTPAGIVCYFITMNERSKKVAASIAASLREAGKSCEMDLLARSMKSQMREANKLGAKYVLIFGDEEIKSNLVILKNMRNGSQVTITMRADEILKHLSQ